MIRGSAWSHSRNQKFITHQCSKVISYEPRTHIGNFVFKIANWQKRREKNERNENKCCLSKRLNEDRKATTRNATQLKILERNNKNIRQKSGKKYKNSSYFFSALLLLFGLIVFVLCLRFFFMCSNSKFSCRFFCELYSSAFFFWSCSKRIPTEEKEKKMVDESK